MRRIRGEYAISDQTRRTELSTKRDLRLTSKSWNWLRKLKGHRIFYQHKTVETYLSRREMFVPLPVQLSSWHASCFANIVAPFLASMDPLHYSKLSRTWQSFWTTVLFLSVQFRQKVFVKPLPLEISFPTNNSRFKWALLFSACLMSSTFV